MFFHRKKEESIQPAADLGGKIPVIRASICTGEKVAGFRNPETGAFEEVMLITSAADLEKFRKQYGIVDEIKTIY